MPTVELSLHLETPPKNKMIRHNRTGGDEKPTNISCKRTEDRSLTVETSGFLGLSFERSHRHIDLMCKDHRNRPKPASLTTDQSQILKLTSLSSQYPARRTVYRLKLLISIPTWLSSGSLNSEFESCLIRQRTHDLCHYRCCDVEETHVLAGIGDTGGLLRSDDKGYAAAKYRTRVMAKTKVVEKDETLPFGESLNRIGLV
ncbi:unnamed protein product [Microthlaspi erraticum]|uniref:Uncharacterized protein n=1 Tax=Microthlaspi erraticum TaxID=1685480 RepID=A0A6D2J5I5_9BRAS|nr:unnamed protein product [Microthlaspi erraticum]